MLFDWLKNNKSTIKTVWLDYNQLDDACMTSLGEYIQSNQSLAEVYVGNNHITDKGIELLFPYIINNTSLKTLRLTENKDITDVSVSVLIKMIETSHIDNIHIRVTSITQQNALVVPLAHNILKYQSAKMDLSYK